LADALNPGSGVTIEHGTIFRDGKQEMRQYPA
jgi:hypothetical protein